MPDEFGDWSDYRRHVAVLTRAGAMEDATKLWWDLRPSDRYPTLEMRASDICTLIDDAMAVAAIYVSLLAMLYRTRLSNQRWRIYSRMLINENVWRAQRYGITGSLIDFAKVELVPYPDLLEEIIELVSEDANELGCMADVEHARVIIERGTSADRQLALYEGAKESGANEEEAPARRSRLPHRTNSGRPLRGGSASADRSASPRCVTPDRRASPPYRRPRESGLWSPASGLWAAALQVPFLYASISCCRGSDQPDRWGF